MSETTNLVWEKQDDGSLAALGGRLRIGPKDAGRRHTLYDADGGKLFRGSLTACKDAAQKEVQTALANGTDDEEQAPDTSVLGLPPEAPPAEYVPATTPEEVEQFWQTVPDANGKVADEITEGEPTTDPDPEEIADEAVAVEQLPQEVQENLKPVEQYDPDQVEFMVLSAAKGTDSYMTVLGTVRATTLAGAQVSAAAQFQSPFLVEAPADPSTPIPFGPTPAEQPKAEEPKAELQPGTTISRNYKGTDHKVEVTAEGLVYYGRRYSSLTAVAKEITGYVSINGRNFFNVGGAAKQPKQPKAKKLTKGEAFDNLLTAAKATLALWDTHGLGDDDEESEPVYTTLAQAIEGAEEVLK
jgi:hypothetical protein